MKHQYLQFRKYMKTVDATYNFDFWVAWIIWAEEYECKYGDFLWFPAKLFIYFVLNVFVCALKTKVRANTGWARLIQNIKTSGSFAWIKCDID